MKHTQGWVKLNTDGCSKGNPGPSSFVGVFRDADGWWLRGFGTSAAVTTNTVAELFGVC